MLHSNIKVAFIFCKEAAIYTFELELELWFVGLGVINTYLLFLIIIIIIIMDIYIALNPLRGSKRFLAD